MADIGIRINATDATKGAFDSVGRGLSSIQSSAAGVAGSLASLGVGVSVGAFVAMTKQIIDGIDAFNDLKDATGASIENISALEDVALRSGASFDTVSTALIKLNQGLNAAKPGSDIEAAIKAIGLSVNDLKKLDPAEAFRQIAVGLSGFADDANKARLTQELFGKSLKEVAPLLKDLADAGELVATVTTEQADQAEILNKQLFNLQANTLNASRAFVNELLPTLIVLAAEFTKTDKAGGSLATTMGSSVKAALEGAVRVGAGAAFVFKGIAREVGGVIAGLNALGEGGGIFSKQGRDAWAAVWDARIEDFESAVNEYNDLIAKVSGAGAPSTTIGAAAKPTVGNLPDQAAIKAGASAAAKALADLNKELSAQTKLLAENAGLTGSFAEDWDRLAAVYKKGGLNLEQLAAAQAKLLGNQPAIKAFNDAEAKAAEVIEKANKAAFDSRLKYIESLGSGLEKLQDEVTKQTEYNDRLGLTKEAIAELDAVKLELQATDLESIAIKKLDRDLDEEQYALYKKQATELRTLAKLKRVGGEKESAVEAAKAAAAEWQKGWDETDKLARDVFASWATDGGNAAQKIGDTLKKALLSAIYEATIRPIALQIYSSIAGGAPGGASGGLANGINTASSLNTLYGAGAQFLTGATAGSSAIALGGANAVGAVGGDALGALIAGNGGWAGVSTAAASTGATAGAAASTSFLTTLSTAAPYLLAAVALAALFKKGEYVQSTGSSVQYFDPNGKTTDKSTLSNNFATAEADKYVAGIKDSYTALAKQLGATNQGGLFAFAANNSDGGKFGVQVGVGSANYSTGELKASSETMTLEASRAVFAALQGSELPKYLSGVFDGITASTATAEQINNVLAYAQGIKTLHDQFELLPFQNLKDLSFEATKGLLELAGGLDKFGTNLAGYYENYYSAEEKRAQTITNITKTLNAAGASLTDADIAGTTKDVFRAVVEAQDLTTEAGRKNYTALLSVQGAFASLTVSANESTTALNAAARAAEAAAFAANDNFNGNAATREAAEAARLIGLREDAENLRDEATQRYLTAQQSVTAAQQRLAGVLSGLIGGFQGVLDGLDGGFAPTVKLAGARANFDNLTVRAQGGDGAALAELAKSAKTFLDLSKGYSATIQDYRRDEAKVRNILQQGIATGNAQLSGLPGAAAEADPLRSAQDELRKSLLEEVNARNLAISMQANLTSVQQSLADQYTAILAQLPAAEGKNLTEYFNKALDTLSGKGIKDAVISSLTALLPKLTGTGKDMAGTILQSLQDLLPGEIGGDFDLGKIALESLQDMLPALTGEDLNLTQAAIDALSDWVELLPDGSEDFSLQDAALDAIKGILPLVTDPGTLDFAQQLRDTIAGILPETTPGATFDMAESAATALGGLLSNVTGTTFSLAERAYAALTALLPKAGADFDMSVSAVAAIEETVPSAGADFDMAGLAATALSTAIPLVSGGSFNFADMAQQAINNAMAGIISSLTPVTVPTAPVTTTPTVTDSINGRDTTGNPNIPGIEVGPQVPAGTLFGANGVVMDASGRLQQEGQSMTIAEATEMLTAYSAINGKAAAPARALEIGLSEPMLERMRAFAGGIPQFAVGTNFVPQDMLAVVHKGEAIIPAAYNPATGTGNVARLERLVEALTAEVIRLREDNSRENNAIISPTQKLAKINDKWDIDGQPAVRT